MRVILTPEPVDQVTIVCEWCQQPIVLRAPTDLTLPIEETIAVIGRALLLHKRVGCVYSERARALA